MLLCHASRQRPLSKAPRQRGVDIRWLYLPRVRRRRSWLAVCHYYHLDCNAASQRHHVALGLGRNMLPPRPGPVLRAQCSWRGCIDEPDIHSV